MSGDISKQWHHGFVNGRPQWEVILQCPVSPTCSVHIAVTGDVDLAALDRINDLLALVRSGYESAEIRKERELYT